MKKIQTIINVVLGAAVIALFVLFFTGNKTASVTHTTAARDSARTVASGAIAYFQVDSVLANWDLFYSMQEELDAKQAKMETEFQDKTNAYQKRVEDAQYKVQRGLVTRAEAEQLGQQLQTEQQALLNLQNNYAAQMQEEGLVKNRQMIDKLEQFLKKYNETAGYSYIFTYTFGGNLLYGDEAFDITSEVIAGINEMFPAEEK